MITDLSGPAFLLIDLVFVIVLGLALFIGALWWRGRRRSPAGRPPHRRKSRSANSNRLHGPRAIFAEPAQERLAAPKLAYGDEFIGLVRLLDRARAADHGGDARQLEQAGLGAI